MSKKNKSPHFSFIRNLYSFGMSVLMVSFFKYNLSFRLDPFISKDEIGRSKYDYKNGLTTTVNYEGAAALYIAARNIIEGKEGAAGMFLTIPGASGATLILERRPFSSDGQPERMETFLVIAKDDKYIPFKFATSPYQVKENGRTVTKICDSGLGAFMKTVEGYLTEIGASLHLDKLPEGFEEIEDAVCQAAYTFGNSGNQVTYGGYHNNF